MAFGAIGAPVSAEGMSPELPEVHRHLCERADRIAQMGVRCFDGWDDGMNGDARTGAGRWALACTCGCACT